MDIKILRKIQKISEDFFGTSNDPEQMEISDKSFLKFQAIHPKTFLYKEVDGEPVSWLMVLPTSRQLADKFLSKQINERELLELTQPAKIYDALYLCMFFTLPEYRKKGYVVQMLKEVMRDIPLTDDAKFFIWPYSEDGKNIVNKLEKYINRKIFIIE